jgi:type I restriction enzyme S subunit
MTGGSLGRCAYVPNDFVEGNVSQHVCIIRPIFQDNYFIHKVILSPYFQTLVFESTTGAGREGLPKYNLEKFIIPIPSISEQYRIATKTEQLMTLYDELEQSVQQNQKYIQELLQVALKEALEPKS